MTRRREKNDDNELGDDSIDDKNGIDDPFETDGKYLVNVTKPLTTRNLSEYAFAMMLSEYLMTKTIDETNIDANENNATSEKNNEKNIVESENIVASEKNSEKNIVGSENASENNDRKDNAAIDGTTKKTTTTTTSATTTTTNATRATTMTNARDDVIRLFHEANKLRDRKIHFVQVRSIPVSDYGYILRHYFVRIDELLDIHPGNEQRICLRGWYENTDIGSDTLESSYELCQNCLDESIPKLWNAVRKFNFVFQNCDQCCNRSHQSIGIGIVCFLTISASVQLLVNTNFTPLLLLAIAYVICFALMYFGHLHADAVAPFIGYNPAVLNKNARSFVCKHLYKIRSKSI